MDGGLLLVDGGHSGWWPSTDGWWLWLSSPVLTSIVPPLSLSTSITPQPCSLILFSISLCPVLNVACPHHLCKAAQTSAITFPLLFPSVLLLLNYTPQWGHGDFSKLHCGCAIPCSELSSSFHSLQDYVQEAQGDSVESCRNLAPAHGSSSSAISSSCTGFLLFPIRLRCQTCLWISAQDLPVARTPLLSNMCGVSVYTSTHAWYHTHPV